jgi:hypothetical protein
VLNRILIFKSKIAIIFVSSFEFQSIPPFHTLTSFLPSSTKPISQNPLLEGQQPRIHLNVSLSLAWLPQSLPLL